MASFLRMPGVSADSDEALLSEWNTTAGAEINEGDAVASVETDKALVDIIADQRAVVHTLLVDNDTTVAVGDPIAVLLAVGEHESAAQELLAQLGLSEPSEAAAVPARQQKDEAVAGQQSGDRGPTDLDVPADAIAPDTDAEGREPEPLPAEASATEDPTSRSDAAGRVFASPIARRLARDNQLSVSDIIGSGPGGRIVRRDVEQALTSRSNAAPEPTAPTASPAVAEAPPASSRTGAPAAETQPGAGRGEYTDIPHSKLRRLVASRLQASKQQAPHFYLRATVRVDDLLAFRRQVNEAATTRVSVNDFFVKAVAKALMDVPEMNVIWTDDAVRQYRSANVAVAIASERGLVTPVVRGADTMSLGGIAGTVKDFVARAAEGRLQQSELEGGTFSVTNLGMFGVEEFAAIINPPQVGILAVGAAMAQPVVGSDGSLEVGTVVSLTLSVDHRPVDGVIAARWLARLRELVENPIQILV